MERKANLLDVQEALSQKVDMREMERMPTKSEYQEMQFKTEKCLKELSEKLDIRGN